MFSGLIFFLETLIKIFCLRNIFLDNITLAFWKFFISIKIMIQILNL